MSDMGKQVALIPVELLSLDLLDLDRHSLDRHSSLVQLATLTTSLCVARVLRLAAQHFRHGAFFPAAIRAAPRQRRRLHS